MSRVEAEPWISLLTIFMEGIRKLGWIEGQNLETKVRYSVPRHHEPLSMTENLTTRTALRPARSEDFDYCGRLYFEGMENIIKELRPCYSAYEPRSGSSETSPVLWLRRMTSNS